MNPKRTWLWLLAAAVLLGVILLYRHYAPKPAVGPVKVLPDVQASSVLSVQVQPAGQKAIRAERADDGWQLTQPLTYPAQATNIEQLLRALEHLSPALFITPQELKLRPDANNEFGFNPPQTSLVIEQRDSLRRVQIGNKTAPGGQVYLQVIGTEGIYVVDAALLKLIPHSDKDWRETALADWSHLKFDRLIATNGGKLLELRNDRDGGLWRMVRPNDTRADRDRVENSLKQLQNLTVREFVSDDPRADLDSYGLQNPDLSLAFLKGTNTTLLLQFGKSPTNDANLIFARRGDQTGSVVKVSKDVIEPWRVSHDFRDFFDHHLVSFTGPLDSIAIHARDDFTLQRQTNGMWRVLPQDSADFPADIGLVMELIGNLTNMEVQIKKEAVAELVLGPDYNLAPPTCQFTFNAAGTNAAGEATNSVIAQLDFGIKGTNVYARRVGESIVYELKPSDFGLLPSASVQMRDRRIWNFTENDVARIVIFQEGRTRELLHKGTNLWSLPPGSQGIINPFAIEEAAHQLGELSAYRWIERGDTNRAQLGFTTNSFRLSIELKDGGKVGVEFGGLEPPGIPYAITLVDREPWIFLFPWPLYTQYVQQYLSIPPYIH